MNAHSNNILYQELSTLRDLEARQAGYMREASNLYAFLGSFAEAIAISSIFFILLPFHVSFGFNSGSATSESETDNTNTVIDDGIHKDKAVSKWKSIKNGGHSGLLLGLGYHF